MAEDGGTSLTDDNVEKERTSLNQNSQGCIMNIGDIAKDEENFLRAILLLLKGGTFISKETLKLKVCESGKNIDASLKEFEKKLIHKLVKRQKEKLFPQGSAGTDIETWDIAMFITVLLTVFKKSLDDEQKNNFKTIKNIRDEVYAHSRSSSLSDDDYEDVCQKLKHAYSSLSSFISNDTKDECADIVEECTHGPINRGVITRQLEYTDDLFLVLIDRVKDNNRLIKDNNQLIKEVLARMDSVKEDRSTKVVKVINTELTLSGSVNEKPEVDFAENIITTVINKAIKKTGDDGDYPKIRKVVEKMLEDIEKLPDVVVLQAGHNCIILKFQCTTYAGIYSLIAYLDGEAFRNILKELSVSVSTIQSKRSKPFKMDVIVRPECLKDILDGLDFETCDRTIYKGTIRMPIEVQSKEGVKHILSMFQNGGATNRLNELSEAVFDELHTRITVTPSIDFMGIEEDIRQTGNTRSPGILPGNEAFQAQPIRQLSLHPSSIPLFREDKQAILRNFMYLKGELPVDSEFLYYIIQDEMFTPDQVELLEWERYRRNRVDRFLRMLLRSEQNAYEKFLEILTKTGCGYIREYLKAERNETEIDCSNVTKSEAGMLLWRNREVILACLDVEMFLDYFVQYEEFTLDEYEHIISFETRRRKAFQFMEILTQDKHLPRGYFILLTVLKDTSDDFLYDKLRNQSEQTGTSQIMKKQKVIHFPATRRTVHISSKEEDHINVNPRHSGCEDCEDMVKHLSTRLGTTRLDIDTSDMTFDITHKLEG